MARLACVCKQFQGLGNFSNILSADPVTQVRLLNSVRKQCAQFRITRKHKETIIPILLRVAGHLQLSEYTAGMAIDILLHDDFITTKVVSAVHDIMKMKRPVLSRHILRIVKDSVDAGPWRGSQFPIHEQLKRLQSDFPCPGEETMNELSDALVPIFGDVTKEDTLLFVEDIKKMVREEKAYCMFDIMMDHVSTYFQDEDIRILSTRLWRSGLFRTVGLDRSPWFDTLVRPEVDGYPQSDLREYARSACYALW